MAAAASVAQASSLGPGGDSTGQCLESALPALAEPRVDD